MTVADRIADDLRARIAHGELAPGADLPTVATLAAQWGVAAPTVKAGLAMLVREGLTVSSRGRAHRVRVPPLTSIRSNRRYEEEARLVAEPQEVRAQRGVAELDAGVSIESFAESTARYEVITPPADVAQDLALPPDAKVLRREYVRRHAEGAGATRSTSYLPYEIVEGNPALLDERNEPWPGGTLHQLATVGVEVARIEDRITASLPTPAETEEQDIPPGVPVMRIRKISYDTTGRPVEVADVPAPADRMRLVYDTALPSYSQREA